MGSCHVPLLGYLLPYLGLRNLQPYLRALVWLLFGYGLFSA